MKGERKTKKNKKEFKKMHTHIYLLGDRKSKKQTSKPIE
jgi:hypothetical protein